MSMTVIHREADVRGGGECPFTAPTRPDVGPHIQPIEIAVSQECALYIEITGAKRKRDDRIKRGAALVPVVGRFVHLYCSLR